MLLRENELLGNNKDLVKEAERIIKNWSNLETIISTISSRFLESGDFNFSVNSSLRDMGILSKADRAYLFLFNDDMTLMKNTHEWCAEEVSPRIHKFQDLRTESFPWWMRQLLKGKVIHIIDILNLPEEAYATKEFLEIQSIKSLLVFPLFIKTILAGFVGFDNLSDTGDWKETAFSLLRISSQIIGNALGRQLTEELLKKSEEKHRLIIENINDLIVIINFNLEFEYFNENSAFKLLGYQKEDVIGKLCVDFIHPHYREQAAHVIKKGFNKGESVLELRLKHKDGSWLWFECGGKAFINEHGIKKVLIISRDITERKLAEERYKYLFENSPNAILLIDFNGLIVDSNSTTKKLFNLDKEHFIGKSINDFDNFFLFEVRKYFKKIFQASFMKDFPEAIEVKVKLGDDDFIWVEIQASIIKQSQKTLVQLIFEEITEKKNAGLLEDKFKEELEQNVQDRTKELNEALRQQKLYLDQIVKSSQFKTEFMATMSHELRTPLNAIIGFADLLLEGVYGQLTEDQREFITDIKNSAEHQFDMIKHILDISTIESGQTILNIQEFSLNTMVERIKSSLKPLHKKKDLKVKIKGLEEERFIHADPIRFKEILLNLLSNAIKFTLDGKVILNVKENYNHWLFKVTDTGIGIAHNDFPIIFKEFKRVDSTYVRSVPGTGLGLSLTKRLIELHGGEISFNSTLGIGSTFTFSISKKLEEKIG